MVNFNAHKKAVFVIAGLLVLSLSLSSCDTLRKNSPVRKRREAEDQAFVPVLEPEEYPAPQSESRSRIIKRIMT